MVAEVAYLAVAVAGTGIALPADSTVVDCKVVVVAAPDAIEMGQMVAVANLLGQVVEMVEPMTMYYRLE